MNEQFTFVPRPNEILDALRVVTRSISRQTAKPVRQLLICAAIYGLPLIVAGTFFRDSFDEIYFTMVVFVAAAIILPRVFRGAPTAIAERYSVDTKVRVGPDSITQTTPTADISWPWASLNRLHILEQLVVLEFHDWSWIPLPNRLWANDGAKAAFLDEVRSRAPKLEPGLPGDVASPFTLINVGAGFGAVDIFVALLVLVDRVARVGCGCHVSWQLGGHPVPFGVLYGCIIAVAIAAFFPMRHALRALDRRQHVAAVVVANLLIWPVPVALAIFAAMH